MGKGAYITRENGWCSQKLQYKYYNEKKKKQKGGGVGGGGKDMEFPGVLEK